MKPLRLAQITDCHLGHQPGEMLLGMNTDQSLYDVLGMIQSQETPDFLLATGDISNDGDLASYERFTEIVDTYFPNTPLGWLPGNHDDPANMSRVRSLPIEHKHQLDGWNLIFLNSRIPMEDGGHIDASELARLEHELSSNPTLPTMIFLHHQPVPVGSEWIDVYVLKNDKAFFEVLDKFDNIKAVCWGHIHQEFEALHNGIQLLATPSTCVQFMPEQKKFTVDRSMPGYRLFELYPDGRFVTEVRRIKNKVYSIDFASTGY